MRTGVSGSSSRWGRILVGAVLASLLFTPLAPPDLASASTPAEQMVFGRSCDAGPDHEIWFVDRIGSRSFPLDHIETAIGVRVSPPGAESVDTGQLLAISTPINGLKLVDLDAPGSAPETLGVGPPPGPYGDHANLAWSGTGDRIAYVAEDESGPAILIHELGSNTDDVRIVELAAGTQVTGLDWEPGGSRIAWSQRVGAQTQGTVRTVDTADLSTKSLGAGDSPRWSPSGDELAFVLNGKIGTMSPEGSAVMLFDQAGRLPVWSPDGKSISFVERAESLSHISVLTVEGGSVSRVVSGTVGCDDVLANWDWATTRVPTFVDVPFSHTFHLDIEWLADEGITKGCGSGRFCPEALVTRAQMAAFLVRANRYVDDGGGDLFTDDDGSIFEKDIDKLKTAGVTRGCNPPANDRFCPDDFVTRAQMAAFLVRAMGYVDDGGGDLFIDDDGSIFEHDIDKLKTAGVTKGCNPPANDRFCPDEFVTRAQIAAFLRRALG